MSGQRDIKREAGKILGQSLEQMIQGYPEEIKQQLYKADLSEKMQELIEIQGQGKSLVMGVFDWNVNEYVTINILSLITLLAGELNQVFSQNPAYATLSTGISVSIFIMSLLNAIQPSSSVELEYADARVYCALLSLQNGRPVNEPVSCEELQECMREIDENINISECLDHLKEKRLIKVVGKGFIVKREVKVKAI